MRKNLFLSTSLAALLASPAYAESWYLVGEGENDLFFADADSINRNGNALQMNVIDSMDTPFNNGDGDVYFLRGPMNINCATRQYQNLGTAGYASASTYIGNYDVDSSWQAIGDGSYAAALYDFGCGGGFRDTPVTEPFGYAEDYWYYYYEA